MNIFGLLIWSFLTAIHNNLDHNDRVLKLLINNN
jgi:hypothetical protein